MANRKLKSFKRAKFRDRSGMVTTGIVVQWDNGDKEQFQKMSDVPEHVHRQLAVLKSQVESRENIRFASSTNLTSQSSRKTGGGFLGTRWKDGPEHCYISWPTIPFASPIGVLGLILFLALAAGAYFMPEKHGQRWPWIIPGIAFSFAMLISCFFFREKVIVNSESISRTRWPAFLGRPRQAVELHKVLNAFIQLDIVYGKNTRRIGTVAIRLQRPNGIEWWNTGQDMSWSEAESIGRMLSRFIEVRVDNNSD